MSSGHAIPTSPRQGKPRPRQRRGSAALVACALLALATLAGCGRNDAPERGDASRGDAPRAATDRATGPEPGSAAAPAPALPAAPATEPADGGASAGPRVALVIDDLGQRLGGPDAALLDLPVPLTLAVLPGRPQSRAIADRATTPRGPDDPARRELFLHLPMEPEGYPSPDPGPGALLRGQSPAQVAGLLDGALASVPGAVGVNNHMGSAATADSLLMSALMAALAERGLRFLDSLTTPRSVAWRAAREAGVPTTRNRIFLDAAPADEATIAARLAELVATARRSGAAVGIAHPHAATAAVLARDVPRYQQEGVRFVTVSELMPPAVAALVEGGEDHGR